MNKEILRENLAYIIATLIAIAGGLGIWTSHVEKRRFGESKDTAYMFIISVLLCFISVGILIFHLFGCM